MTRLVIADDHALFRQGLIRLLESTELQLVAECRDGIEALAAILSHHPDVAVLDISMPGLDGISVLEVLRQKRASLPVIFLTMHDAPDVCRRAMAAGASGFLLKDSAFEELQVAIQRVVQGKRFVSPALEPVLSSLAQNNSVSLTDREQQVLRFIARGYSNRLIAEELAISIKTVDAHRTNLMRKLDLHSTAALVRHALLTGLD